MDSNLDFTRFATFMVRERYGINISCQSGTGLWGETV